jgi:hypothetical protein
MTSKSTGGDRPNGIKWRVPLRSGQVLSLKRHCKGSLRQVVGYFENMAEKDPTGKRFVFAGPVAALAGISKRHPMHRATFFRALAEARTLHIISGSLQRIRNSKEHVGVIVTHPEALCVREGSFSVFRGKTDTPPIGHWREEDGVVFWHGKGTKFGEKRDPVATALQLQRDSAATNHATAMRLQSPKSATENATADSMQPSTNDRLIWGAWDTLQDTLRSETLESVSHESLKTLNPFKPSEPTGDQGKSNASSGGGSSLSLTDQNQNPAPIKIKGETIGDHFALGATVEEITDGELDPADTDWSEDNWKTFLGCIQQAVDAKAALPFSGRTSCAQLMGDSMKLLRECHGKDAPRPWVPIMKLLRETRGPAMMRSAGEEIADDARKTAEAVKEFAEEIAKRHACPGCGVRHPPPYCKKPDGKT